MTKIREAEEKKVKRMKQSKWMAGRTGQMLYSKLAGRICDFIMKSGLNVGDKIPSERVLAEKWGVSRASMREALKELENQGILSAEIGKGTFVSEGVQRASFKIAVTKENLLETYEIKEILEGYMIQNLTEHLSEKIQKELERWAQTFRHSMENGIHSIKLANEFRKEILGCYENQEMISFIGNLNSIFAEIGGTDSKTWEEFPEKLDQTAEQMILCCQEMVNAMLDGNVEKALKVYHKMNELEFKRYGEALQ